MRGIGLVGVIELLSPRDCSEAIVFNTADNAEVPADAFVEAAEKRFA